MIVLDSSAMLALLRGETEGTVVWETLEEAEVPVYAHAINLCEVFYDLSRARSAASAQRRFCRRRHR